MGVGAHMLDLLMTGCLWVVQRMRGRVLVCVVRDG
jgi:hypothetical protein